MDRTAAREAGQDAWSHDCLEFRRLSCEILHRANSRVPRPAFLREVAELFLAHIGCDALEILLQEDSRLSLWKLERGAEGEGVFEFIPRGASRWQKEGEVCLKQEFLLDRLKAPSRFLTPKGSLHTGDTADLVLESRNEPDRKFSLEQKLFRSLVWVPFRIGVVDQGLLEFRWRGREAFAGIGVPVIETLAEILGIAILNHRAQTALGERIKELTCLYGLARAIEKRESGPGEILQEVVELLPPAWRHSDVAAARIVFGNKVFVSPGWREGFHRQVEEIISGGRRRGQVEVVYTEKRPAAEEGPFVHEERELLNTVAREVGRLIEKREVEEERTELQDHLRHADRLATIGQLAAGVAHELNEPLGSILGFAQLGQKQDGLPRQTREDLEKITTAALHSREVIKKLMLFARVQPSARQGINLNRIVEQGLHFLAIRAEKSGIEFIRKLSPDLPDIMADVNQIHQVLVNLVVNSIQAMPDGGHLLIETSSRRNGVVLAVEDRGVGMSPKVQEQMFVPFFTTKQVGEGTGLGLAVVHGIVSAHGGTIRVRSREGEGTRMEIHLPLNSNLAGRRDAS